MVRIISADGQLCVVPKDLADLEDPCRRAAIPLLFPKARLVLSCQPCSPGKAVLAEQDGKRPRRTYPVAAVRPLEQSHLAAHRIPSWRNSQDELCTIIGNVLCASVACQPN